jgi:hypothetical protein
MCRRPLALFLGLLVLPILAACVSPDSAPNVTSGPVVPTSPATTLHPYDTTVDVTDTTLPPNAVFGGDPCTALTANEIARVRLGAFGYGRLFRADQRSSDSCLYLVLKGDQATTLLVKLINVDTYNAPPAANETLLVVDGVGDDAAALTRDGSATVMVHVGERYVAVTAPDLDSATALARLIAPRMITAITTTSTTDPGPIPTASMVPPPTS